jgi:hypothetical protein
MPTKPGDKDPLAREVERLLKKLPGADPSLRGTPEPAPRPPGVTTGPRPAIGQPRPALTTGQIWGLVGRVAVGVGLGVALTQWPYASRCGWPLLGYLAAVLALLLSGGWAAVAAWKHHVGIAHAAALIVFFWGVVLAAEQVLPRVGYAAESATWRCRAATPVAPARATPAPASPTPADSTPG